MRGALLLVAIVLGIATGTLPSAAHAVTGDQAQGAGAFGNWDHCVPGSIVTFDLNAVGGPGQSASGTFSFICGPVGLTPAFAFSGTVSCLVLDGRLARVGGTVTATTHPNFHIGDELSFSVQDGGPAGIGDFVSTLLTGADCALELPVKALIAGDIVVAHVSAPPASTPATVALTPPAAINDVGTSHTVTATVTTAGGTPSAGYDVHFAVTGSVSETGACTTDAQGQCSFTYAGPDFPGADVISGCADADKDGQAETGEPCGEATKIWTLPATTPGEVTGGGWIVKNGHNVIFGLNAESDAGVTTGHCNVVEMTPRTHVKCVTVDTLVITGTHATLFGQATVDGVATTYRIDVDDNGEPGTSDTFAIVTASGYAAGGTLGGGNIQIHD